MAKFRRLRALPKPLLALMFLEAALKIIAAWKAARRGQLVWAVALVVVNSAGLLPLLYLLRFQKSASPPA